MLGTFVEGPAGDIDTVKNDSPFGRSHQSDRHAEAGRLSRAVGAEESDNFPFVDMKRDSVDSSFTGKLFDEIQAL